MTGLGLVHILLVALGGALGGMARFGLTTAFDRRHGDAFPWGTIVVNVSGAALIGLSAGLVPLPADSSTAGLLWTALAIGLLGSYTTVSSFSLQTLALLQAGRPGSAALNVAGTTALCLAAAALAYASTSLGWPAG